VIFYRPTDGDVHSAGDVSLRKRTREIYKAAGLEGRAKNSVEAVLASF